MSQIQWIKIATDIFNDEKILIIESLPEADAIIVIWFKILALAGKTNESGTLVFNNKFPYTEDMLSTIFRRKKTVIQLALKTFCDLGMIEIVNDTITIPNWEKHQNIDGLEKIRLQNKERQQKHRDKQRLLLGSNVTDNVGVTESNGTEEEEEEEKDKNKDIDDFFEQMWKAYPRKKGKGSISDTAKKRAYKLGSEFEIAIQRYIGYAKASDTILMYGSTFWNSGYVDYLDENYEEQQSPQQNERRV